MSGFQCKRNTDVDIINLQSQLTNENVMVYMMMLPHKCCYCGGVCRVYLKMFKTDNGIWKLACNEDEPKDACCIGNCCFDEVTKLFKMDTREKAMERKKRKIEELETEIEELESELKRKRVELSSME